MSSEGLVRGIHYQRKKRRAPRAKKGRNRGCSLEGEENGELSNPEQWQQTFPWRLTMLGGPFAGARGENGEEKGISLKDNWRKGPPKEKEDCLHVNLMITKCMDW